MDISTLQPNDVFYYFQEISRIPRGSGNEKAISDYLVVFAKEHDLWYYQDDAGNVIIKKPATANCQSTKTVILQGHMDMVCEKNQESAHDFEKDPIELIQEGDFIHANGTTLGGDNGIAVAYALAILSAKDLTHPAIEALFTTNEETGMDGAQAIDANQLSGDCLINIDSEEEGCFLVSCAGGMRVSLHLPIAFKQRTKQNMYHIGIRKLHGGHSGMDIIKQRANAIKLLGRIVADLSARFDIEIVSFTGGAKDNAIPREADCIIATDLSQEELQTVVQTWQKAFSHEFLGIEAEVLAICEPMPLVESDNKVWTNETTQKAIATIMLTPNGVLAMSKDISGLVETSNNLGVVSNSETELIFTSAVRSAVSSRKDAVRSELELLAKTVGATVSVRGEYPSWEYQEHSPLRELFCQVYEEMYHKQAEIKAIHAGLECGLLRGKLPHCDMISLGPDMYDVHTPQEKVSISSVCRVWALLTCVLEIIG